jgi:hypothetical protein
MDRLHYSGNSLVTGTDIARAVVRYAAALAKRGSSAPVQIPVLRTGGDEGVVTMLVGPASQLITETESTGAPEIIDRELVERLTSETRRLGISRAESDPDAGDDADFEMRSLIEASRDTAESDRDAGNGG